MRRERPHL